MTDRPGIGRGLRRVREAIGMPRRMLATLIDLDEGYLACVEIGTKTLSLERFSDLATALEVPQAVIAFYGYDEDPRVAPMREVCDLIVRDAAARFAARPRPDAPAAVRAARDPLVRQ